MSPEKKTKSDNKNKCDENSPFDIFDSEYSTGGDSNENDDSFFVPNLTSNTVVNLNSSSTVLNDYDEDDEEDFIKIYFASGTVLKPSDQPYNLRSKINQANQELAKDSENNLMNVHGKVKFDNTVVVLDSFDNIGTISVGTERLQGADIYSDDVAIKEKEILAEVDLTQNEEDDQNDVICSISEKTQQDTDTDEKVYSSTSFSRSFSSESDDPLYINMIESGDEFKTIMNRNNKTRQGSAIDEHVTYFPELFSHTQYKLYENSSKKLDDAVNELNIYVPKKLDAEELRNKLKEISKERKIVVVNENKMEKSKKKIQSVQKKIKQIKINEKKIQPQPASKPRMTYYFELDPKGKLTPLNKNNMSDGNLPNKSTKFFHINLKAAKNDENSKPRISRTPNTDLFLEFQTDKSGNKGAKLVIKKKLTEEHMMNSSKKSTANELPRLPGYNGLRSEYGLSAEQLLERRKLKMERERLRKEFRQKKREEEQKKRAENEKNFYKWLQQKKQQKKPPKTRYSYPISRLTVSSARNSIKPVDSNNQRKGSFALEELLKIKDENNGWFKF